MEERGTTIKLIIILVLILYLRYIGSYTPEMVGSKKKVSKQIPLDETRGSDSDHGDDVDPETLVEVKESDVKSQLAQQGQILARMMERLEAMQVAQASMADELARVRAQHTVGRGVADVGGLPASGHRNEVTASHDDGGNTAELARMRVVHTVG